MKSKKHNHSNKHKKTTTSQFVKLNCSPENENKNSSLNEYTCYSNEDLHKLPLDWFNTTRQNYKINQIIPRKKELIIDNTLIEKKKI